MAIMIGISKGLSEAKTLEILNGFKYKAEQLMGEVQKHSRFLRHRQRDANLVRQGNHLYACRQRDARSSG